MSLFAPLHVRPVAVRGQQVEFRWTEHDFAPVALSEGVTDHLVDVIWAQLNSLVRPPDPQRTTSSVVYRTVQGAHLDGSDTVGVILLRQVMPADVDRRSNQAHRQRLATRALLIPDADVAARVALGLCVRSSWLMDPRYPGVPEPPPWLPVLGPGDLEDLSAAVPEPSHQDLADDAYLNLLAVRARLIHQATVKLAVALPPPYDTPAVTSDGVPGPQAWLLAGVQATAGLVLQDMPGPAWEGIVLHVEELGERPPGPSRN